MVILTAISITTFQQFRPLVASPQKPVTPRTEDTSRHTGPRINSSTPHQSNPLATARVETNQLKREEKSEQAKAQNQDFIALSKGDGTY